MGEVLFTNLEAEFGKACKSDATHIKTQYYKLSHVSEDGTMAKVTVTGGDLKKIDGQETYFTCLRNSDTEEVLHQGSSAIETQIRVFQLILPVWFMSILIVILLCL